MRGAASFTVKLREPGYQHVLGSFMKTNLPSMADVAQALNLRTRPSNPLIASGQNNLVYDFTTVIVRVPRHADAERDLEREADILAAIRPHLPVPVPALTLHRVGEHLVSVHEKLEGEPLLSLADMALETQRNLACDLAAFLRALHALPVDILPPGSCAQPTSEWHQLFEACVADVFPRLPADAAARIRRDFEAYLAASETLPRTIIHSDFGTGNILVRNGTLSGVIDFAGCGIGDPAYDFASLAAGLGDGFIALMPEHYPGLAAMQTRMAFYRCTFPLLDVLFGLRHGDTQALNAGLSAAASQPSLCA